MTQIEFGTIYRDHFVSEYTGDKCCMHIVRVWVGDDEISEGQLMKLNANGTWFWVAHQSKSVIETDTRFGKNLKQAKRQVKMLLSQA